MAEHLVCKQKSGSDEHSNDARSGDAPSLPFTSVLLRERIFEVMPDGVYFDFESIMLQIEIATRRYWDTVHLDSNWEALELTKNEKALRIIKRKLEHRRPEKKAVRAYVTELVTIYESGTGHRVTRIYETPSGRKITHRTGRTKRHPFLLACFKIAGIITYPTGIIRDVIEQR